jgi:hypothetical protein
MWMWEGRVQGGGARAQEVCMVTQPRQFGHSSLPRAGQCNPLMLNQRALEGWGHLAVCIL